MMDTYVTIYARGPEKLTSRAIQAALDRMGEVDKKFSIQNQNSPLYAFNYQDIPITDKEILYVVQKAMEISEATKGAFDITVSPLLELWGFYEKSPKVPAEEDIKSCLKDIGYKFLVIKDGRLCKTNKNVRIDCGAIAKGYAIGQALQTLKNEGINSALIDAGGDVYALGKKGNTLWKVGIRNPQNDDMLGYLEVEDMAVVGSGDYERYFMENGKRYHHIFDPKTGYPTEDLSGITVIHPDPMLADAWATALFVLGHEKGLKIAEQLPKINVVMITSANEILYSSQLKKMLTIISK
ncbi:MAG: FAD:protein FMN transferase [Candidatus Omnitrophica bacterium]|nr:FAD:protein FMN transferase [Candidatus Omnitrophota bacterium]